MNLNISKKVILFMIISLSLSLFFNYKFYKYIREENELYTIYINDFFIEIENAILQIELITKEKNKEDIHQQIFSLTEHLNNLDYMVRRVPYYIDGMGGLSNFIGTASTVINRGTKYEGSYIPPFINDHKLTKQEIAYLELLKSYLEIIYKDLLSKRNNQLSEDITKNKFKNIINENIYVSGKEDKLLEEYINNDKN